ncbi:Phospholipase A2 domain-containing protein [Methylorubrum aminovorans]
MTVTTPAFPAVRRLSLAAGVSAALLALATSAAVAQSVAPPVVEAPTIEAPTPPDLGNGMPQGALVFHGNYCGPGSRGAGLPPVDALDRACMHHDACSPPVGQGLPTCSCNDRLAREATVVARTPRISDELRTAAQFVAVGAKALACEP